jgi:phage protein D
VTTLAIAAVEVHLDGTPLPATVRVLSVRTSARFGAPGQCEISLHDPAGYRSWPAPARLGAKLTVGLYGEDDPLFAGEVTAVELARTGDGAATARVRGYDVTHRLRKRQTLRVMERVTAAAVARALTADLGVTVDGGSGPALARVVQHRQHDFDLLVEVAARTGHLVALDGTTLRLATLDGFGPGIPLAYGYNLYEAAVEANLERVAGSVAALGWDAEAAEQVRAVAGTPRSGRRIEFAVPDSAEFSLVEHPAATADDVGAAAQLALDVRTASSVVLRGVAAGDARIRAGARIDVTGMGDDVDGRYVVCQAVHRVDADGFQTTFSTEPPALPSPERGAAITLGRVTEVGDPGGHGRVRVSLPAFGDIDAGWLGVVCPGAGRGKGLVALPDVGDTVAVALPHAEPTAGLVLGSLYGSLTPPDDGVTLGSVRRWSLRTDDGQSIVVDDGGHSIRLQNKDGSYLEIAPDAVQITAKTDLVLDAAGHSVTIRGRAVDFEHALI